MTINIVPLLAGLVFASLGIFIVYDYYRFNRGVLKTRGKILRYDEYLSKDKNGRKLLKYRPHFEFSANGRSYQVKSKTSFSSKMIPVGNSADVLYHQGNEEEARLAKGNGCGLGILFIFLALPALYFGLLK